MITEMVRATNKTRGAVVEIPQKAKKREDIKLWALVVNGRIASKCCEPVPWANAEVILTTYVDMEDGEIIIYEQYKVEPYSGVPFCIVEAKLA